ncbi:hypothetical protein AYO49_06515 [Verrucomicrobiaceae bacterium SCGC AG-212-N21]|nr:hypothetical protein AYO49_06515 [Verrucomicrobiaceae bacterium SCGC AG-212-N21]
MPRDHATKDGPQLWAELHAYAWTHPREATAADQRQAREWLAAWAARIPAFGCSCHKEWARLLAISLPPLEDGPAFYWWTVAAHDRINRKLNKPLASPAWSLNHPLLQAP